MNKLRKCLPGFALVLTMVTAGIAAAQNPGPGNAGPRHDSCCSANCGDSCDMTNKDAMKNHVASSETRDCCGDSCDLKKKDAMKNHVASADKDSCCCCGDSCDMTKKDAMKNHVTSADQHDCCCGATGDMKSMKDMKKS